MRLEEIKFRTLNAAHVLLVEIGWMYSCEEVEEFEIIQAENLTKEVTDYLNEMFERKG